MADPPGPPVPAYEIRESAQEIDPDTQCAVPLLSNSRSAFENPRCSYRLQCKIHTIQQKERVADRTMPFAELLQRQPLATPSSGTGTTGRRPLRERAAIILDPDVHCAVVNDEGIPCTNAVNCNLHSMIAKSAVQGRSMPFGLVAQLFLMNKSTDQVLKGRLDPKIHCYVTLPDGEHCPGKLSCPLHDLSLKAAVQRHCDFMDILELQVKLTTDIDLPQMEGFGISSAASSNAGFKSIHKLYRRNGMQVDSIEPDVRGEANDIDFVMCDPIGNNLESMQSLLYHTLDTRPSRNLTDFLSPQKRLANQCSKTYEDDTAYHFCFANQLYHLRDTVQLMRESLSNGKLTECCMISAPKKEYGLDASKAAILQQRLLDMIERVPTQLCLLTDVAKHRLLVTAMFMEATSPLDVPTKIPFHLEQAMVDSKPVILLRTTQFNDLDGDEDQLDRYTAVAIPLHADFKEGAVAPPSPVFEFHGLEFKKSWAGVELTEQKQAHIRSIAQNILGVIHLTHADPSHIRWVLTMLSELHGIPLLCRQDKDLDYTSVIGASEAIAELDDVSGSIRPTANANAIAPYLPTIQTTPGTIAGHLVLQCIKSRFLHTKDLLLAWADGANASDMQRLHGDEVMEPHCQCSVEQAKREYHTCRACRALTLCTSLTLTLVNHDEFRLCPTCVAPPEAAFTGYQRQSRAGRSKQYKVSEYTRVRNQINQWVLHENDVIFSNRLRHLEEREEAFTALLSRRQGATEGVPPSWVDGYLDSPIVAEEGRLAATIETAQPLVWSHKRSREHIASNMLLTKAYANQLCGSNAGIALQIFHKLDASTSESETAEYILRADHLHIIRSQIPWSEAKRFATDFDETFQAQYTQQWQTGVADLLACEKIADLDTPSGPYLWRLKVPPGWVDKTPDSLPNIHDVRRFIEDLEQSTGRRFRRLGGGVPYPFSGGPDPTAWSWALLYGIIHTRFKILQRVCNSRGTTAFDVPRLICATFYLIAHGGCPAASPLFKLPVSCYSRHMFTLSIGKGRHDLDMYAGLSNELPITLRNFNAAECNLCIEPWLCNTARGNRDEEVDAIREDFRQHLRQHNPPYWSSALSTLDPEVTRRYIQEAPQVSGQFEEDAQLSGGSGGGSEGNDLLNWEPVLERRNMRNLGQTCYLSTLLQLAHNDESFRRFVADDSNFIFKEITGLPDINFLPSDETVDELDAKEIVSYRQQKLASVRLLIYKLQKLFKALDRGGMQLSESDTRSVLNRITTLDPRWQNHSEEPAQLLSLFIEFLSMACDASSRTTRGRIKRYSVDQEAQNKEGKLLLDVRADASTYWTAFCGEGHDSEVTDMFLSQIVKEIPCAEQECLVVSRAFEHTFVVYLDFPRRSSADEGFNLEVLLDLWAYETLDVEAGHRCEHVPEHPRSLKALRRFTKSAQNVCFAFLRGVLGEGEIQYSNHVILPETLDFTPYSDLGELPSRRLRPVDDQNLAQDYDLVSVNNWKSGHYVGYALVNIDGNKEWVMFNDLHSVPVKKSPFQGHAEVSTILFIDEMSADMT